MSYGCLNHESLPHPYVIAHDAQGQGIANATIAAALGARPDSIKRAKRRLRELGYIDVSVSVDGVSPSVITIVSASGEELVKKGEMDAEGGDQDAPPFHVSESTCVDVTPPPESEPELAPEATVTSARPEPALRRRRSVLLNMIRAGVPERRRLAFTAELAEIEAALGQQAMSTEQPPLSEYGASYQEPTTDHRPPTTDPHIRIAHPEDPHPVLTDTQLTAVLRDALCDTLTGAGRALLERVSWRLEGDQMQLICAARDLAPVTGQLLAASRRALADLGLPCAVRVQIGRPMPVGVRPAWIDDALWARVPVWARGILVGSVVVEGRLFGATAERTAGMRAQGEVVEWVCEQMHEMNESTSHGYRLVIRSGSYGNP